MRRVIAIAVLLPCLLAAETGLERLREIRAIKFLPEQCFRVRDLFLEREDVKFHLSDGYLLFAEPVEGRAVAAVFLAATDTGDADIVLIPPTRSERQSMARFLAAPVLNEKIRTVMMFFTDDTAEVLRGAMAENPYNRPEPETGAKLVDDWTPVARNMITGYETRILLDTFSEMPRSIGFFAAAVGAQKLGRFDVLIDPRRPEQISVGQIVWHENQRYYDVWTSFAARSARERRKTDAISAADLSLLENYRIEAALSPELDMQVTTHATLVGGRLKERVIPLELSQQLKVSEVSVDGRPVEFLQNEPLDSSGVRRRGNDLLVLVLDRAPEPGGKHELEFQYRGNVITDAGHGVYYVGSRGNWYPGRGYPFASFDLVFRYPRRLQLVATGRQVETSVGGEVRTTRFKPDGPIRLAGFNLGNFERTSLRAGDYTVEVCANKELEPALRPPIAPVVDLPQMTNRRGPPRSPSILMPVEEPPKPVRRIDQVARDSAEAMEFFSSRFGSPPVRHLVISPIPGRFGQGFPGLVYVSTLSYYQPDDKPLEKLSSGARFFYSEQLRAHEIAHQWWGNLVTASSYHDEWLMESLADYSALLFLEQHKGVRVLESVLARYKANLLAKLESGETMESVGAIVLGDRLQTSRSPYAHHTITYEKGTWVLHMLRRIVGDQKFLSFLSEIAREYRYRPITTEQFRELAVRFMPAFPQDPKLENFFNQWVYSTGIPTLKMEYKVAGSAPKVRVTGMVRQTGVPEDFSVAVPIEIQGAGRAERVETRVHTAGDESRFSVNLKQRPTRVVMDPRDSVLAVKQ